MKDDQFDKLFKYMQQEFATVNRRLDYLEQNMATKDSIDRLIATMDGFIKRIDDNETELAARDAQFERLLAWARKVSDKTGIPLEGF